MKVGVLLSGLSTTPHVHVTFGHLAEFLRPHARYVVPNKFRDTLGKTLATQNEMFALGLSTSQHGVMDIFVQHMLVQYSTGQHLVLVVPPRVMLGKPQAISSTRLTLCWFAVVSAAVCRDGQAHLGHRRGGLCIFQSEGHALSWNGGKGQRFCFSHRGAWFINCSVESLWFWNDSMS